jgi:Mrp family chromosome partitioning ATPase
MRGILVTGTGTDVGKSGVAAALCAALAARRAGGGVQARRDRGGRAGERLAARP